MKCVVVGIRSVGAAALLLLGQVALADTPQGLEDLVGARGAGGETQMQERGYEAIRSEIAGNDRNLYWRHSRTGACVIVRVSDGRYASLTTAPKGDCTATSAAAPAAIPADGFESVCGVTVDGKPYRYRCVVSGAQPGKQGKTTVLEYPDQTITLEWRQGDDVGVTFEGMNPVETKFSNSEGNTQFTHAGKTYFYVSNREAAALELRDFRGN